MEIVEATTAWHLEQVRGLLEEFIAWDAEVTASLGLDTAVMAEAYYSDAFDLPGPYLPPDGRLLLAVEDGVVAGCGALRRRGPATGEVARMFVRPGFRGRRVGHLVLDSLLAAAREVGYERLWLSTGTYMAPAQALYRAKGFREIEPYYELPEGFREITLYMELELSSQDRRAG